MKFEKGHSGNPKGRPKGKPNKVSNDLRSRISLFLDQEFETMIKSFRQLPATQKLKFYSDLLNYSIPKLSASKFDIDFENFTDAQLDYIIDKLKH